MSKKRKITSAMGATVVLTGVAIVGMGGSAQAAAPRFDALAGSVAPFVSTAKVVGDVATSTPMSVEVWLKPNEAGAAAYATDVSTPGNVLFHHYLSPAAFTARFGATPSSVASVESWLRSDGFKSVGPDAQRNYVRATGSVATINSAFRVQMKEYASSGSLNAWQYVLRSNDRAVSIPTSLAGRVIGITGLDNAAPLLPLDRLGTGKVTADPKGTPLATPCSQYYGEKTVTGLPSHFGTTTFGTQACGYTATQMRAAYGANMTNTGSGQTIALVELGLAPEMFLTLEDYAIKAGLPLPNTGRYEELSLGNGTTCGDEFDEEEQLDVEASYAMAPAANQIVIGGDSCNNGDFGLQGLFNADIAIIDGVDGHPLASVASNSWDVGASEPAFLVNIQDAYLTRAATEGVGMYFSSGDGSGLESPSQDPWAISVGGTTLGLGSTNNRLFETGWSTAVNGLEFGKWVLQGEQGAGGGGPSQLWAQPSYQKGVVSSAFSTAPGNRGGAVRSVPDISADADPFTGFLFGLFESNPNNPDAPPTYQQSDIGGTSLASPLVAGMVVAAEQGQSSSFGFIDPVLYKLSGTDAFNEPLPLGSSNPAIYDGVVCAAEICGENLLTTFDDQSNAMTGYFGQVTVKGYNNMTGLGTPNGQDFINALRAAEK